MRIIVSGSTYSHIHGHMYFTKSPTVSDHLKVGLQAAGHSIRMEKATDLLAAIEEFKPDLLLLGLTPAGSMSARQIHYEWEAITYADNHKLNWSWFIDDWQFHLIPSSFRSMLNDYPRRVELAAKKNIRLGDLSWKLSMEKDVHKILRTFLEGKSKPIFMVYFKPSGPLEPSAQKYTCGNRVIQIDPSGVFPMSKQVFAIYPEKQWVLAALGNYSRWLGKIGPFGWPIKMFGPTRGAKDHVLEAEIVKNYYAKSWGMLVPSYPVDHGRLWRSRYVHGYLSGAITFTSDEAIRNVFGKPYQISIQEVEKAAHGTLDRISFDQQCAFENVVWSSDHFVSFLDESVRSL